MGAYKNAFITWHEQEATEEERELPYFEQIHAFAMYIEAHENWMATVQAMEDEYIDHKLGIKREDTTDKQKENERVSTSGVESLCGRTLH